MQITIYVCMYVLLQAVISSPLVHSQFYYTIKRNRPREMSSNRPLHIIIMSFQKLASIVSFIFIIQSSY